MLKLTHFTLLVCLQYVLLGQSYIKFHTSPDKVNPVLNSDIKYGFSFDMKTDKSGLKGSYFESIMTRGFIDKIDLKLNGVPYTGHLKELTITPEMFNNPDKELIISYQHPKDKNLRNSDTIKLPKIVNLEFRNKKIKYGEIYKCDFDVYFDDNTQIGLNDNTIANFESFYNLKISSKNLLQYNVKSSQKTSTIHKVFDAKKFNGNLNEFALFTIDADDYHQDIHVPFSYTESYDFDFRTNRDKGQNGKNVRLIINKLTNELFSVEIEADLGATTTVVFNPKLGVVSINASGDEGSCGRSGSRGSNASNYKFGSTYIAGNQGGNGGNGGNGGHGGNVTVLYPSSFSQHLSAIKIITLGGKGGDGGSGGSGGRHQFASEQAYKNASYSDCHAASGMNGEQGMSGQNGLVNFVSKN